MIFPVLLSNLQNKDCCTRLPTMAIELSKDLCDFHQDGVSDTRFARPLVPGVVVTPNDDVPRRLVPNRVNIFR
jgi:hypothetical protein